MLLFSCNNKITNADRQFIQLAGSAGMMKVEMGKLAAANATKPAIADFGKMMVAQHSEFNNEFNHLLKQLHENGPNEMNDVNRQIVEDLKKCKGAEFDRQYIHVMIENHWFAVEKFNEAYNIAHNKDDKAFLGKGKTIVAKHYEMTQALQKNL